MDIEIPESEVRCRGRVDSCRVCLCEEEPLLYPCRCSGSLGFHTPCFFQLVKHKLHHSQPVRKRTGLHSHVCEICGQTIHFKQQFTINYTPRFIGCMVGGVLDVVVSAVLIWVMVSSGWNIIAIVIMSIFVGVVGIGIGLIIWTHIRINNKVVFQFTGITLVPSSSTT